METTTVDAGPTILIVGTNEGQTRQMGLDLQEAGYAVKLAYSSQEGMALARQIAPALIVVDRLLGGGVWHYPVAKQLRNQGMKVPHHADDGQG